MRIQLASGEFRDLALETRKVNSMAKLQDAVADACERDLPASEQDRLGELVMQVIEADGARRVDLARVDALERLDGGLIGRWRAVDDLRRGRRKQTRERALRPAAVRCRRRQEGGGKREGVAPRPP